MRSHHAVARAGIVLAALLAAAAPAAADPIASAGPAPTLPAYQGAPATARALTATVVPQNPFLGRDPFNNIHDDTWMTNAYRIAGPLGRSPLADSGAMPSAICGSLTFDTHGHIVSICPSSLAPPTLRVIDPATLTILGTYALPEAPNPPGTKQYQNFTGGGYFFLDAHNRVWAATKTSHLVVLAVAADGRSVKKVADYDLTGALTSDERITSALPDFAGNVWFVSKKDGKVGVLNPKTKAVHVLRLGEEIENSFAVDRDAAYIVSDKRMYRFSDRDGRPHIDWKSTYRNSGIVKPSQLDAGSGTTPTIMRGGLVAITDNADPMDVVVYRRAARLPHGARRVVCQVPVFAKGASATENSIMTAGRSLWVENNYGYQDPFGPNTGALSDPGFARVDVDADGKGCHKVWTNTTVRAPTAVPKLSTKTGLIYTYTRDADAGGAQGWYWTAIDAVTGRTAFEQYAGSGLMFNNNYAGVALGPDGNAYLGVIGGVVALRDRG